MTIMFDGSQSDARAAAALRAQLSDPSAITAVDLTRRQASAIVAIENIQNGRLVWRRRGSNIRTFIVRAMSS